jgi:hypothetical protein
MTQYVILLPGDEARWQAATEAERAAAYDRHRRFMDLLQERGHRLIGGAELTHSREARVVRGELDAVTVSEGPYAETVEQLTGFYGVESDDLDDLLNLCGLLAGAGGVEVRAAVEAPQTPEHAASAGAGAAS